MHPRCIKSECYGKNEEEHPQNKTCEMINIAKYSSIGQYTSACKEITNKAQISGRKPQQVVRELELEILYLAGQVQA